MGANAQTSVPVFTTGQVLTAAQQGQINTGVPVFATTATRDAAFGGTGEKTLAEGQFIYQEINKETRWYSGTSFETALALGAWATFTPTFTSIGTGTDWAIGNATTSAAYLRVGRGIFFRVQVTWGSTTTFGTKALGMSLPLASIAYSGTNPVLGEAAFYDASAAENYAGRVVYRGQTEVQFVQTGVSATYVKNGSVTSTLPFTWVSTDQLNAQFYFENNNGA
jgi:hypothetical protein